MSTLPVWKAPSFRMIGPDICRWAPAAERRTTWEIERGPVPEGMRVGWTCFVPYCGKLHHMELAEDANFHRRHWGDLAARIAALSVDEYFDVLDLPNDEAAMRNARAALGQVRATQLVRFLSRALNHAGRGVRFIRTGTFASFFSGTEDEKTVNHHPVLIGHRIKPWLRPQCIWLGQWFSPTSDNIIRRGARCTIRACPHPALHGAGEFCYQHNHFFDYKMSMTDNKIGPHDMWVSRAPYLPWSLAAEIPRPIASLEKSLRYQHASGMWLDNRHKNIGNDAKPTVTNYSRSNGRLRMRLGGGSHSGSKTTAGKARRASGNTGSRHDTKEKRWTRETIEALEREADHILGLDTEEIKRKAEEMRLAQMKEIRELAAPVYPLCQSYEVLEEELTEEEERERLAMSIGTLPFDDYDHEQTVNR